MPVLPASLALTVIADGSNIVAADHRTNYASIQAAVNALIAITSNGNGTDGDAMVWDGVNAKWVAASTLASTRPRAPRVVTSAWPGGPPASPLDQDIWIATAVGSNGERCMAQYNAGSASTYKWEVLGADEIIAGLSSVADSNHNSAGAWVACGSSVRFAVGRGGDYVVKAVTYGNNSTGGSDNFQIDPSTVAAAAGIEGSSNQTAVSGGWATVSKERRLNGLSSSDTITAYTFAGAQPWARWNSRIYVTPARFI